jgi:ADP-heptose:LPS heptosyltransferase
VYAEADVVVAADSGPLHLAAAAGAPVVALFGPKDPDLYGPRTERRHLLFASVPCRPCRRRTCASPQCVLGVEVDAVERAVCTAIEGR